MSTSEPNLFLSSKALAGARTIAMELMCVELTGALAQSGIASVLLKGPSLARWLYDEDASARSYADCDLLLSPTDLPGGRQILRGLGFEPDRAARPAPALHSEAWIRPADEASVDLHSTLPGLRVAPEEVWRVLSDQVEAMSLRGRDVPVLNAPARALHVALHAAHHSRRSDRPMQDLARALQIAPYEVWSEAASLAGRLDALQAFHAGLRLVPEGQVLARRLELPPVTSAQVALRAAGARQPAKSFELLAQTPRGLRLVSVLRKIVPAPSFLRAWSPLARRGGWGLALAYVWRPLWLLARVIPGLTAWLSVRRDLKRQAR